MTIFRIFFLLIATLPILPCYAAADEDFEHLTREEIASPEMRPGPFQRCINEDFDQPPILISGKKPVYPVGELLKGKMAAVAFSFTVTETGAIIPSQKNVNQKTWFLNHLAIASKDWIVQPATKNGSNVSTKCQLIFAYILR